jgi:SAM-dependent methyltransferase
MKFDLHKDCSGRSHSSMHSKYDLVLCEQVLEHVEDPYLAVANLSQILKPGGILHISVPGVNNVHSDPYYFYAGFHYRALTFFIKKANLKVIESDGWCSDKGSRMYSTCDWAPISQSAGFPDVFNFLFKDFSIVKPYAFLQRIKHIAISEFKYPFQRLFEKDSENLVISWIIGRKE